MQQAHLLFLLCRFSFSMSIVLASHTQTMTEIITDFVPGHGAGPLRIRGSPRRGSAQEKNTYGRVHSVTLRPRPVFCWSSSMRWEACALVRVSSNGSLASSQSVFR